MNIAAVYAVVIKSSPYWDCFSIRLKIGEIMIYFDNAATTGHKPISVINAVNNTLKNFSANPGRSGHKLSEQAAMIVYKARESLSDFFGAEGAENIAFTANCTTSINFILKGVLSAGDNVVISDLEHNAVMRPLKAMNNVTYTVAEVSLTDDNQTVNNFENAINKNTKMIFCTSASYVLGKILPIKRIGELCKKYGLMFGVDAAQGAGVIPINMKEMNIDFLCIAPHKGLYAPMGLGVLIARKPLKRTIIEGGTGTDSVNFSQPDIMPEMLESGTVNLPAIAGTTAGIEFIKSKQNCVYDYEMKIANKFYEGLQKNGKALVYTNLSDGDYVPVLSFNLKDTPSDKTAAFLNKNNFALRAGLHCAPTAHKKIGTVEIGTVRFSPSIFNNEKQVEMLLKTLKNF